MRNNTMRNDFFQTATSFLSEKHSGAICAFIAGSVVRNEATETSDIDLVVLCPPDVLPKACRCSTVYQGWPIEAFLQNDNSLAYFWEQDIACGSPALLGMIAGGIIWPEGNERARSLQEKARTVLAAGPAGLSGEDIKNLRFGLTDLLDDMEGCKKTDELYGILSILYQKLANFHLRANRCWSGNGKALTRALRTSFPDLADEYESAFKSAFAGDIKPLSALADKMLRPFGGRYWTGLISYAPDIANQPAK